MRGFLLSLLLLTSLNTFAQSDFLKVKEGSFHKINGFVMVDKHEHTDVNDAPMALIKISTDNITAEQRRKFIFKGNLATYFDVQFKPGEIYLYISAAAATFIEIIHDDYGKIEYWLPESLCDFCGYEMVIQYLNPEQKKTFVAINSEPADANIYIDGKFSGVTPNVISDLSLGKHELLLEKDGYESFVKTIDVKEDEMLKVNEKLKIGKKVVVKTDADSEISVGMTKDSPSEYSMNLKIDDYQNKGINFLTINGAYSIAPQMSFGLTYGRVKKIGWFASAMTNLGFDFNGETDSDGVIVLSGKSTSSRLSVIGGVLIKMKESLYAKFGAGYGMRVKRWESTDNIWYIDGASTYKGVELSTGLQLNAKNVSVSADVVTTNFKTMEFKLGIGVNWN